VPNKRIGVLIVPPPVPQSVFSMFIFHVSICFYWSGREDLVCCVRLRLRLQPGRLTAGFNIASSSLRSAFAGFKSFADQFHPGMELVGARGFEPPTPCSQSVSRSFTIVLCCHDLAARADRYCCSQHPLYPAAPRSNRD
jgi:hypothetical protein